MTFLLIQIVTGIGLALVYVPAADRAYESLLFLDYQQPLGWFLRALHYYAGSGMVVMLTTSGRAVASRSSTLAKAGAPAATPAARARSASMSHTPTTLHWPAAAAAA